MNNVIPFQLRNLNQKTRVSMRNAQLPFADEEDLH